MSTAASSESRLPWSLVVPVKVLALAKTRMAAAAGPHRQALALAVAADTVAAALRCAAVRDVIVVTDDPVPAAELAALGATVVPDRPDAGLNPALEYGAARGRAAAPDAGVGALSADLPALRPDELARVLAAAAGAPEAFVPDAQGVGTTLYTVRPGVPFRPAFGGASRDAHRAQGARELLLDGIASVRRDVDTPGDLATALALGTGPRTAAVAALLDGGRPARPGVTG
ncbi:2-phospho-L-lactate guanylyltransferase [Actinomadura parmotrematis]|uniref:Phosphoenolpyruvate guanylyltransferase n=1 Tax=Actinomadura parmotrematis TaxID=2864039 RepID=A0ABS7G2N5_9ACTN|nr:2-phospho-L-lactate guanylyltransferase [Actinomadura parmotrematis]MBW8486087.1 2-phospho-L-lactate guanylyltransferase [Actinomadura parmotrematis]